MPFTRYVEIGRVALINYGEDYGKLVVISDVIDQNRVRAWTCQAEQCAWIVAPASVSSAAAESADWRCALGRRGAALASERWCCSCEQRCFGTSLRRCGRRELASTGARTSVNRAGWEVLIRCLKAAWHSVDGFPAQWAVAGSQVGGAAGCTWSGVRTWAGDWAVARQVASGCGAPRYPVVSFLGPYARRVNCRGGTSPGNLLPASLGRGLSLVSDTELSPDGNEAYQSAGVVPVVSFGRQCASCQLSAGSRGAELPGSRAEAHAPGRLPARLRAGADAQACALASSEPHQWCVVVSRQSTRPQAALQPSFQGVHGALVQGHARKPPSNAVTGLCARRRWWTGQTWCGSRSTSSAWC